MGKILNITILVFLGILCFILGCMVDYFIPFWWWVIAGILLLTVIESIYIILLKLEDTKSNRINWRELKIVALLYGFMCGILFMVIGVAIKDEIRKITQKLLVDLLGQLLWGGMILIGIAAIVVAYFWINYLIAKKVIKKGKVK